MKIVKLADQVRYSGGVAVLGALIDQGIVYVEKREHVESRRAKSGYVTEYLAVVDDGQPHGKSCWKIGQKAYESRAAKHQDVPRHGKKE